MIVVRNVFQLKFGKAKEAMALMKESTGILQRQGEPIPRYLTDLTGPFYTLVMELSYDNLAALEKSQKESMSSKEFGEWYQRFIPLVESGHRELYTVIS